MSLLVFELPAGGVDELRPRRAPSPWTAFRYATMDPTGVRARRKRASRGWRVCPLVRPLSTASAGRDSRQRATGPPASKYLGWIVQRRILFRAVLLGALPG